MRKRGKGLADPFRCKRQSGIKRQKSIDLIKVWICLPRMGHVQQNVGGHCIVSLTPSSSTILPLPTIFLYSFDEYDFLNGIQLILSQASFCLIVPTISYATPFHFTFLLELTTREVLMNSAREIIRERFVDLVSFKCGDWTCEWRL